MLSRFERRKIHLDTVLQMFLKCVCHFSCSSTVTPSKRCFETWCIGVVTKLRFKGGRERKRQTPRERDRHIDRQTDSDRGIERQRGRDSGRDRERERERFCSKWVAAFIYSVARCETCSLFKPSFDHPCARF